jgi:hypothetical protein
MTGDRNSPAGPGEANSCNRRACRNMDTYRPSKALEEHLRRRTAAERLVDECGGSAALQVQDRRDRLAGKGAYRRRWRQTARAYRGPTARGRDKAGEGGDPEAPTEGLEATADRELSLGSMEGLGGLEGPINGPDGSPEAMAAGSGPEARNGAGQGLASRSVTQFTHLFPPF